MKCLLSTDEVTGACASETYQYLNNLCCDHRINPLLITFRVLSRSSNTNYGSLRILLTNHSDSEIGKQQFSDLFMSLALTFSSNRPKQTFYTST